MTDHVHMLIQVQPTETIASVVQYLKGGTSKKLREEFPELEEFLWGESFWSDGYFAETIGQSNFTQVKKYIAENQESMLQQSKNRGLWLVSSLLSNNN